MKKVVFLVLSIGLWVGITLSSCQTSSEKVDSAENKVSEAKEDLVKAKENEDAEIRAAAEFTEFKKQSDAKILENEQLIIALKNLKKDKKSKMDVAIEQNIDSLKVRNERLKVKINGYERGKSDWESFKREFSHDMSELGKAINDLTVNNKK